MSPLKPPADRQAFAQRGEAVFERAVRPTLEARHHGHFVVIDVDSGDYEIDPGEIAATDRLLARRPDARLWLKRVGYRAAHRFGPSRHRPST